VGQALSWHGLKSEEWEKIGPDNRAYVAKMCRKHGELGRPLAVDYMREARKDHVTANQRLRELSESLELGKTGLTATVHDGELKKWCERHADEVEKACEQWTKRAGVREAIRYAIKRVEECGLVFPIDDTTKPVNNETKDEWRQAMARVFDPKWWRLQVRKIQARKIEAVAREIRLVHKESGIYASNQTVNRRKAQKHRNREALTNMEAVNDNGEAVNLLELAKSSVANPVNRRAELMVRIKGFEQCAETAGHVGLFITLTAPSKYHRMTYIKSWGHVVPNKKYQGYDPKQAQQYFCRVWSQIRAQLWREDIRPYGFRVAEPHHDGTPHWHLLLFVDPEHAGRLKEVMHDYGTREDGKEYGAQRRRVTVVDIDPDKGSAAGYIAKYISKNIDGHAIDEDLYGKDAKNSAERIDAWAAAWGIRQFQQIGGASVTVWRELRRLNAEEFEQGEVLEAIEAADSADWAAYTMIQGGMTVRREDQLIRSHYQDNGLGVYFQPVKRLIGVIAFGFGEIKTRIHEWVIQKAGTAAKLEKRMDDLASKHGTRLKDLRAMSRPMTRRELAEQEHLIELESMAREVITDEMSFEDLQLLAGGLLSLSGKAAPWTRGNNCTPVQLCPEPSPPGGGTNNPEGVNEGVLRA
jgi:hypothetical protein